VKVQIFLQFSNVFFLSYTFAVNIFKNHIYKNMSLKTLKHSRLFSYIETRFWIKLKNISRTFEPQIGKKLRTLRLSWKKGVLIKTRRLLQAPDAKQLRRNQFLKWYGDQPTNQPTNQPPNGPMDQHSLL
jgi:hypothetical protein